MVVAGPAARQGGRIHLAHQAGSIRARRRLYVIGNLDTWGNERYFNVLAARIPRRITGENLYHI